MNYKDELIETAAKVKPGAFKGITDARAEDITAVFKPGRGTFEIRGKIEQGQGVTRVKLDGVNMPNLFKVRFSDYDGTTAVTARGKWYKGGPAVDIPKKLTATPGNKRAFIMDGAGKVLHVFSFNVEPGTL